MRVQLPSGKEVRIGVAHQTEILECPPTKEDAVKQAEMEGTRLKGTRVWITWDDVEIYARSVCKPPDMFCKTRGRRYAANHLVQKINKMNLMDKFDRRAIFLKICPEFDVKIQSKIQKEKERREYLRLKAKYEVMGVENA